MDNFNLHSYFKKQYLNEEVKTKLDDLTFDMLVNVFTDNYKDIQFTRKQPDGKEGNYYRDSITLDGTSIGDASALETAKAEIKRNYGNVDILLKPEENMWFNKTKIVDDKYDMDKKKEGEGMKSFMDREISLGRTVD
mgnify:FL=1|tara:strand:- start:619 stop:1029 length:411 start_codon:yes stop_codon:yes gene_type:complete